MWNPFVGDNTFNPKKITITKEVKGQLVIIGHGRPRRLNGEAKTCDFVSGCRLAAWI